MGFPSTCLLPASRVSASVEGTSLDEGPPAARATCPRLVVSTHPTSYCQARVLNERLVAFVCLRVRVSVCRCCLPLLGGGGGNSTKERTLCNDDDYVNKRSVAYHPLRVNSDLSSVRFTLY